ncbi:uncharacterized protein LOC105202962 [Solenopsis invicta]|uniref:uncharacterized protein LOC105202962 n=1 Tax=Solenopsis invicta TaxID=13686 RepID=UPI000595E99C|nr:uncharacterized protein LOC105202962 [Solenopsis invicta]
MGASSKIRKHLHSVQKLLALRIARAYRTSPNDALMVLAGVLSAEFLATARATLYARVLTGHGSFGEYVCRIEKEPTARCHHCEVEMDSAQHTLVHCPAWDELRRVLKDKIGEDLSVVAKMVLRESCWKAVASFCEQVMLQKKMAKIARQRQ